jgi:hypothetical protein
MQKKIVGERPFEQDVSVKKLIMGYLLYVLVASTIN